MGRFKNKKVVVKDIDFNEKGDLTINGKSALKFRIVKEFLSDIDFNEIIKEATTTDTSGGAVVDDGPTFGFGDIDNYVDINDIMTRKLGFKIVDYIVNTPTDTEPDTPKYKNDGAVSYGPAGVGTGRTPNNQIDLTGSKVWTAWEKYIDGIASAAGMKFVSYLLDKDIIKQTADDSKQTKKLRDTENPAETEPRKYVEEQLFTKNWWKNQIEEQVDSSRLISVATKLCKKYGVNPKIQLVNTLGNQQEDYAHFDFDLFLFHENIKKSNQRFKRVCNFSITRNRPC
jgi:DNA modification methylase